MNHQARLWNGGLVVLVVGLGFFYQSETPVTSSDEAPAANLEAAARQSERDSARSRSSSVSATGSAASRAADSAKEARGEKKDESQLAALWTARARKHASRARNRVKARRGRPPVDEKYLAKDYDPEKVDRFLRDAEHQAQKNRIFRTLPGDEQDRVAARINDVGHDLRYYPDSPELWVKYGDTLEDARMHTAAISTMNYAFEKFPESTDVAMARGKLWHKYGFRHQAEEGYERVLKLDPSNEEARGLLEEVKERFIYHPGDVKYGVVPESKLRRE